MAQNTVEATLRSKFEDGISRGVAQTQRVLEQGFQAMQSSGASLSAGFLSVFGSVLGGLQSYRERLSQAANESESGFQRISLGAAAMALAVTAGLLGLGRAFASFLGGLAKEASEVTEMKIALEGLAGGANKASALLTGLRQATEGLVGTTDLLRNANRVLSSGIPITTEQYIRLTENVSQLAKASGVDLAQALTTTTDGLIRGNARGLQAVGIHLNVKDAVSQAAEAMGQNASRMADSTRLQTFYNELLAETDRRVKGLPPGIVSLEDATVRVEKTWRAWLLSLGEAINRSGVVQELLTRLTSKLVSLSVSGKGVDEMALAVNRFVVGAIRGFAQLLDFLGILSTGWNLVWGVIKLGVNSGGAMIASALYIGGLALTSFLELLAKIPGPSRQMFAQLAADVRAATGVVGRAVEVYTKDALGAFRGFDENRQKMHAMAQSAAQLANELEQVSGKVIRGAAGVQQHGAAAAGAAVDQDKLNQQLKTYGDLMLQLDGKQASAREKAFLEYIAYVRKIEELNLLTAQQRQAAKDAALTNFLATLRQIDEKERQEEIEHQRQLAEIDAVGNKRRGDAFLAFWKQVYLQDILNQQEAEAKRKAAAEKAVSDSEAMRRAVELSQQGKIGGNVGAEAARYQAEMQRTIQARLSELNARPQRSVEDINEIVRLSTELEKLQRMNMSPLGRQIAELCDQAKRLETLKMDGFRGALQELKDNALQFVSQAGQSFAAFFADLTSGQESSGKKFLAAFLGMIGQVITNVGVMMLTLGTAELLASWGLGVWAGGANPAHAASMIAKGAALAAVGGIMQGAASSMAGTNSAGAGATFQQQTPQPTTNQTKVIQVGAPGRAQDIGSASAQAQAQPQELRIRVESNDSHIVRVVKQNVNRNGALRVAIQNA